MDDRTCKHCGHRLYYYMVTPGRSILRSLEAEHATRNPLICEYIVVDGTLVTLQHEEV